MSISEARNRQRAGKDRQFQERFSLDVLAETEQDDSPLIIMLDYWLQLRRGRSGPPLAEDFKVSDLWEMKIPKHVALMDCTAADPAAYFALLHPSDIHSDGWLDGNPMANRRLCELDSPMLSQTLQADYHAAKSWHQSGMLHYCRLKQVVHGMYRDYYRLLLPFAGPANEVAMIAVVHRKLVKTRDMSVVPTWAKFVTAKS